MTPLAPLISLPVSCPHWNSNRGPSFRAAAHPTATCASFASPWDVPVASSSRAEGSVLVFSVKYRGRDCRPEGKPDPHPRAQPWARPGGRQALCWHVSTARQPPCAMPLDTREAVSRGATDRPTRTRRLRSLCCLGAFISTEGQPVQMMPAQLPPPPPPPGIRLPHRS